MVGSPLVCLSLSLTPWLAVAAVESRETVVVVVSPRSFTRPTLTPVATTLMDTWGLIPPASLG